MQSTMATATWTWMADHLSARAVLVARIGYATFRMSIEDAAWQAGHDLSSVLGGFLADQLYLADFILGVVGIAWAIAKGARRPVRSLGPQLGSARPRATWPGGIARPDAQRYRQWLAPAVPCRIVLVPNGPLAARSRRSADGRPGRDGLRNLLLPAMRAGVPSARLGSC
jgi:hypothetical protein